MPNRREREFRRKRGGTFIDWHPSVYSGGPTSAQLHAREQWQKLLHEGDPAKEKEARQLARQAGISEQQIDMVHAANFAKPKAAQPVPAAQPPAEHPVQTSGHFVSQDSIDKRNGCRGSFKGKGQH